MGIQNRDAWKAGIRKGQNNEILNPSGGKYFNLVFYPYLFIVRRRGRCRMTGFYILTSTANYYEE
jgi:hypothetical protein